MMNEETLNKAYELVAELNKHIKNVEEIEQFKQELFVPGARIEIVQPVEDSEIDNIVSITCFGDAEQGEIKQFISDLLDRTAAKSNKFIADKVGVKESVGCKPLEVIEKPTKSRKKA